MFDFAVFRTSVPISFHRFSDIILNLSSYRNFFVVTFSLHFPLGGSADRMKTVEQRKAFMYKIFDISLPDAYIRELTGIEISILIEEARTEHLRLEKEINETVQPTFPVADLDDPTAPMPSEYSYDPMLYRDEIAEDPALEGKLEVAKELSERVGLVLAVLGSAQTHRARIINLEAQIDRERSRQ